MGVDAAFISDAEGNGLLVVADSMNLNFEQTDQGIVLTVNAAVAGQGPKSSVTSYPVTSKQVGTLKGRFTLYQVDKSSFRQSLGSLFVDPAAVPSPFRPFETQYDTYLMHFRDICPDK